MKFSVEFTRDKDFKVTTHDDLNSMVYYASSEKELDSYVMTLDKPIIQILPNGKEKVIAE